MTINEELNKIINLELTMKYINHTINDEMLKNIFIRAEKKM